MRIGLLGASFDTGNLGVNALAESSIKIILNYWPDAEITLLDSGRVVSEEWLRIGDMDLCIKKMLIRVSRNIFLGNHFISPIRFVGNCTSNKTRFLLLLWRNTPGMGDRITRVVKKLPNI